VTISFELTIAVYAQF